MDKVKLLEMLAGHRDRLFNLVGGEWVASIDYTTVINPLDGTSLLEVPDTQPDELDPFLAGLASCPKYGVHNPHHNVQRYLMLGRVCVKAANLLSDPEVAGYFAKLIQLVVPKSFAQCMAEVTVTREFLYNFCGDRVRFLVSGTSSPGDRDGQRPQNFRFPYGPVVIIAPFNFPLEIPALQFLGALFMGNRPLLKGDSRVSIVIEQFVRLLQYCGLPMDDLDLIHCSGPVMNELVRRGLDTIRMTQYDPIHRVQRGGRAPCTAHPRQDQDRRCRLRLVHPRSRLRPQVPRLRGLAT